MPTVTGIGEPEQQSLTRRDRGWYHYMINVSAISFNTVRKSGRDPSRDTFAYFATCQDNRNTYGGLKEANFFMGPSLYNSSKAYKNLVAHDGSPCSDAEECFFLHSDMLHESPACPGIVHDPEILTSYGTVFWAIDGVVNQLVRYDFQQPHGPGLMDHSFAAVRRYPDIPISRGPAGVHAGMVIDPTTRALYISNAGDGSILRVFIDTGKYARTARQEYPIFSSRLPSFEYSIYECTKYETFASGLDIPSGLAIHDGQLFVAEYSTGNIHVYDLASGFKINTYSSGGAGLMGLTVAPLSGTLFGVNAITNQLLQFEPRTACRTPILYVNPYYTPYSLQGDDDGEKCVPDATIPDITLFEQVHVGTGYDDQNEAVQNDSMVDEGAALLAFRTDCEYDSELNFDALLLGGWLCHTCLPDNCMDGGKCQAIQWDGYACDNEVHITYHPSTEEWELPAQPIELTYGRTYR